MRYQIEIVALVICAYIAISAALYRFLSEESVRREGKPLFRVPESKGLYTLLNVTWGLPMTLIGAFCALLALIRGHRPERVCGGYCFYSHRGHWGISLGIFFFVPKGGEGERLRYHEAGHGVQNAYLGIFMPTVVCIPSLIRFWWRKANKKAGKEPKSAYDEIWFEKEASACFFAGDPYREK